MTSTIFATLDHLVKGLHISPLQLNNMYSGHYIFTLNRFREMLKTAAATVNISHSDVDLYLLAHIKDHYLPHINNKIKEIEAIPLIEQKTPEWFKQRETMISASDAGYFLKKCGNSKAIDTLKIKIGLKPYVNSNAPPLMHGNTFEDTARAIYESRNGVSVTEYGIISSPTSCIGASPDGVVTACHLDTFECQSKYGRLLEIKNPYSREIDNTVKPEYMVQILQQQYTMSLPICDFVETTIVDANCRTDSSNYKPYITLTDMLNDKLDVSNPNWEKRIKNKNIPNANLNKFGNEKGLVVWYSKRVAEGDTRHRYILYPLKLPYEEIAIKKWVVDMNSQQFQEKYEYIQTKYWRLDVYSEKTVVYDKEIFEDDYVPKLCEIWEVICKCKALKARGEDVASYIEELENKKESPFYNEKKRKKKVKTDDSFGDGTSDSGTGGIPSKIFSFKPNNDIELDF